MNFSLDLEKAETFRLAKFENADAAFFSRRVVLFEGESDDAYCRAGPATLGGAGVGKRPAVGRRGGRARP
ncbi:hypothetical protein CUJ89_23775 [Burkholderia pyrrocinia]|uniref:Uncharacterized protein n=1 Tax=Burkholderia pyrrocinia TaxID=60550 RepID=A0A2Z5N1Q0_BURPY|nr:hypothetical protein CUJ89_23775 [Burkholderia pyrrocinia]